MVGSRVENINFSNEFQAFCHPAKAIQPTFLVAVQNVSISVEIQKCCISNGISMFLIISINQILKIVNIFIENTPFLYVNHPLR